jgi:beta-1,4-N-acetylglucosaminyltransferase
MTQQKADVLLVCSSGGHLLQLLALHDVWGDLPHVWVTEGTSDARSLLEGETVIVAHWPAERSLVKLVRNVVLAWQVFGRVRPRVVLTTGAALAVPFAWVSRIRGARVVFVESLTRVDALSLSGRLISPASHRVYVQWPDLARNVPGARYAGAVFSTK